MASLDALGKPRYPLGRRHTRNRTSYGSMHNWLHSELSGHNLSGYQDSDNHLVVAKATDDGAVLPGPGARFILASQRACQTVPEEAAEPVSGAGSLQRLATPCEVMPDYPQYRELRQCMTERDRNRHGVNFRAEDLASDPAPARGGGSQVPRLPILPSPRPHDQHPPLHLQYGPQSNGYDDAHKAYLKQSRVPNTDRPTEQRQQLQPRLRNGKGGSTWRHLKFPMQPDGQRIQFLDGQVSLADAYRRQLAMQPELLEQHRQHEQRVADAANERMRRQAYANEAAETASRVRQYDTTYLIF